MSARSPLLVLLVASAVSACGEDGRETPTMPLEVAFTEASCDLAVAEEDAVAAIELLIVEVEELRDGGSLSGGQANALLNHLTTALRHLEAGRACPALAALNAFREQVGNFVDDGVLTSGEAGPLTESADLVIEGPPPLPHQVTVHAPSGAAGVYEAAGAAFGAEPTLAGVTGSLVVVSGATSGALGCDPLVGFPAGAVALVDRGDCNFTVKVRHAQDAGAVAVVVMNVFPGRAVGMAGDDPFVIIPAVMVSQTDGATIRAGLPATGTVARAPGT